jgi:glycoside/pentoside/hexuronide:cation symporter, GPH family
LGTATTSSAADLSALLPTEAEGVSDVRVALSLPTQIGYGIGQIAGQIFRDVPSLLLLFFMTTALGIAPAISGAAIFIPKLVFGVGCDMAVGVFSDRWQTKIARRWWLLAGAVGAPLAMILLFHVPEGSTTLRVAYVAGIFSLYMAVFASFSVPYLAISGEMTDNPQARTVLMAWRLVFTSVGVLIASGVAPAIVQMKGGGQAGYEAMALVLAAICPVALLIAFVAIGRFTPSSPAERVAPLSFSQALSVLAHPRFSVLCGVNIMQLAGMGMGYASLLYFLSYNMARADALQVIGGIIVAACAGIILAQPLWVAVSKRIGKRKSYIAGSIIYSLTYIIWALSADAGIGFAYVLSFIAAVGNSGWTVMGFSMVSDVAGEDEAHSGLYSAAWVASDKIGFALGGTLLVGLILSGFGFDAARAVQGLPQTSLALTGVMFAFGFVPAVLNLSGAAILSKWGRD